MVRFLSAMALTLTTATALTAPVTAQERSIPADWTERVKPFQRDRQHLLRRDEGPVVVPDHDARRGIS